MQNSLRFFLGLGADWKIAGDLMELASFVFSSSTLFHGGEVSV